MTALASWRRGAWVLTTLLGIPGMACAQSENSNSLDPDEAVQIVYAVYGGIEDDKGHYVDVTNKVASLLQKSPEGFSVTEDVVLGKHESKPYQSLIIVYNYEQNGYFYNMAEDGGTVSFDTLRSASKIHTISHFVGAPLSAPDDDFRVVLAVDGVGDTFWNVTEAVKQLIHDRPDGFLAIDVPMDGDPHWGWDKVLVIIFDDSSGRHFFAETHAGALHINKEVLLDSVKSR